MPSIPPKYAVSQVVNYIKAKSAIHLARVYGERKSNFVGRSFWGRRLAARCSLLPILRFPRDATLSKGYRVQLLLVHRVPSRCSAIRLWWGRRAAQASA